MEKLEFILDGVERIDAYDPATGQNFSFSGTRNIETPQEHLGKNIGQSLKKLCKECGWTPYQLAKQTGMDKKLVLGHINKDKSCSLGSRKRYADAFSKALRRPVSVDDLES
jgi:hypothetical protein